VVDIIVSIILRNVKDIITSIRIVAVRIFTIIKVITIQSVTSITYVENHRFHNIVTIISAQSPLRSSSYVHVTTITPNTAPSSFESPVGGYQSVGVLKQQAAAAWWRQEEALAHILSVQARPSMPIRPPTSRRGAPATASSSEYIPLVASFPTNNRHLFLSLKPNLSPAISCSTYQVLV